MAPAATARRGIPLLVTLPVLAAVLAFAFDSMHGQLRRNGWLAMMEPLLADGGFLPDSQRPIKTRYTGVGAWDKLLALGNIIFANVTDGSRPELSLYAIQFGGQLVPMFLVMIVEGLRVGSAGNVIRLTIFWGLAVQAVGFGVIMPIYCTLHLLLTANRPVLDAVLLRDHVQLRTVIPAFGLGYYLLSALMSYPFDDAGLRQILNAAWQGFPLHVVVLQLMFAFVTKRLSIGADANTPHAQLDRRALGSAYRFALIAGTLTQWLTYYVTFTSAIYSHLFPGDLAQSFTPDKVFLPGALHSSAPMKSAGAAIHDFLIYDQLAGSVAALLWATTLAGRSAKVSMSVATVVGVLRNCVLVGPGGAVVMMMMQRDDSVLSATYDSAKR